MNLDESYQAAGIRPFREISELRSDPTLPVDAKQTNGPGRRAFLSDRRERPNSLIREAEAGGVKQSGVRRLVTPASTKRRAPLLILAVMCLGGLAGCSGTQPKIYPGLASAAELAPNRQDTNGHIPFLYSADNVDWPQYTAAMLDPVTIYSGPDAQFGDTSHADKIALANYMQAQFSKALGTRYTAAAVPGPKTLRIHVTLAGIASNTPVLSTITKLAPAGILLNSVQTARGKEGTFAGSVSFAVEIYDSTSNRLLRAYVSKQYPWAENVADSFGTLDATRAGIRNGAEALLAELR